MVQFDPEHLITWYELAPSLQAVHVTLQENLDILQRNYTIMVNRLDKFQQSLDKNTQDISVNTHDIATLKGDVAGALTSVVKLEQLVKNLHISDPGNITAIKNNLDDAIADIVALKTATKDNKDQSKANLDSINTNKAKLAALESRVVTNENGIKTNKDDIAKLNTKATEFKNDIDTLKVKNTAHESKFAEYYNKIKQVTDKMDTLNFLDADLIKGIDKRSKDNETNLNTLNGKVTAAENKVSNIDTGVKNNKTSIDRLNEQSLKHTEDIAKNKTEIDKFNTKVKELTNDVIDLNIKSDYNTLAIDSVHEQVVTNTTNIATNKDGITDLNKRSDEVDKKVDKIPNLIEEKVKDALDKRTFLNLAPKINFLQEDTLECYSVYFMNNMIKSMVTSDADNNELVYLIANNGVDTVPYDMYCGTRSNDTQSFYFSNNPIAPKCFKDGSGNKVSTITDIMTCDNDYIVAQVTFSPGKGETGWYLIKTKYSKDPSMWTEYKSLKNYITNKTVGIKYFAKYDTLVTFSKTDHFSDLKTEHLIAMRIYKYSTDALIDTQYLDNPMRLLKCNTSVCSFSTDSIQDTFALGNASDIGYDLDTPISNAQKGFQIICEYYEEVELLVMILKFANMVYVPIGLVSPSNRSAEVTPSAIKISWKCTTGTMSGDKTPIELLQKLGDFVYNPKDKESTFYTENIQANNLIVSYDTLRGNVYNTYRNMNDYNNNMRRYKASIQKELPDNKTWGTYNPYIPKEYINTPDACPWGKWFYKYIIAWDYTFINCSSMLYGDCVIWIKDWTVDPGDRTTLFPAPGAYYKVDPLPVFTRFGDTSCKMNDKSARYFHSEIKDGNIVVEEYIKEETTTDFKVTTTEIKKIPVNLANIKNEAKSTGISNPKINTDEDVTVFYNAIADNFVFVFVDETNDSASYQYSNFMFMGIMDNTGNVIRIHAGASINKYSDSWKSMCQKIQTSNNEYIARVRTMTFISDSKACFNFYYHSKDYANRDYSNQYVEFSNGFDGMSMRDGAKFEEKIYTQAMPAGTGLVYSGPKLGLTFEGDRQDHSYQSFLTQLDMPNIYGNKYTDENMVIDGQYNRYKIQLKSSTGLVMYLPSTAIFLGGYYSQTNNPIPIKLIPNAKNFIYVDRDPDTRELKVIALKEKLYAEGERTFSRILIAEADTDTDSVTNILYYRINNGYNDYVWHR
jgi:hypothetical protein|nr:MAG TPA: chromosome segregation ATPase [Caudoviricetes sp.]